MKSRLLDETTGRTWVVVFDDGDDPVAGLTRFAGENEVGAAHFSAIGAFRRATLLFWDPKRKEYLPNRVEHQVEVVAFSGNVAEKPGGGKKVHVHAVLAGRDARALGGHLQDAEVFPTLEVIVREEPAFLRRRDDEATGLALIDPGA